MSTQSQSNPACAMISAELLLGIISHPPSVGSPLAHFCRNRFSRIPNPPWRKLDVMFSLHKGDGKPRREERLVSESDLRVPAASLVAFARAAFEKLGMAAEDAQTAAEILIDADLMGLDTHGIAHLDR